MPERAKHISTSFDAALYSLKNDVLMMSSLTDRIFQTAFAALLNRNSELCDHVVAEDEEIDILEKQVDQEGVSLLIRFHPVASDMREVVSSMKVSTNLEHADEKFPTLMSGQNWLKPKVPNFADDLETRSQRGKVPNFNVQLQVPPTEGAQRKLW